ncbi:MAG: M17 family metallopeptidase [Acidiferrobacter sp.]
MLTMTVPRLRYRPPASLRTPSHTYDHVALLVRAGSDLRALPFGEMLVARARTRGVSTAAGQTWTTEAPDAHGTVVAIGFIDDQAEPFTIHELARKLVAFPERSRHIALGTAGLGRHQTEAIDALVAAVLARAPLPHFQENQRAFKWPTIDVFGRDDNRARLSSTAQGNHLARTLTTLPGNYLTPAAYIRHIRTLAHDYGWRYHFYDEKRLSALGAGAFLAVTRTAAVGSGIVHLRYRPRRASGGPVALVGKGICFDTGGVNLKSARHMFGMHEDMAGSAVALGTLLALTTLKVPFAVDCYLAIAENAVGPQAYRPNDVVRAMNGTTIEIVHTDAEGRLVLADTLTLACRNKPALIIDYATLTGACIYALGSRMTGGFTNRPAYLNTLMAASRASGERVWPFPLAEDYLVDLRSDIADIRQCTLDGEADHILAALFLRRFLDHDPAWVHLDLAAGRHKGGLGLVPTDTTGFGVRFTLSLLLDHDWPS